MKIGILGTRGIPNRYGGFEQFAETLSLALVERGHEVIVYCSSLHEYKVGEWKGVQRVHCLDKEDRYGTAGQFIYDRNCLLDANDRNFDVLLHLGYTSDSIWRKHWPKKALNVVNMDGLEWKRTKYNWFTRQFLKKAEAWAANTANIMVADNPAMKRYLEEKYKRKAIYIPYPVAPFTTPNESILQKYKLEPGKYFLSIARMEPENNLEMIIRGYLQSGSTNPLMIVGNTSNRFGRKLEKRYGSQVVFPGAIYDQDVLNSLRYFAAAYLHGHSVGGTNPSLLEAMACGCGVIAHDNVFNREVLKEKGRFFGSAEEVTKGLLVHSGDKVAYELTEFSLDWVVDSYLNVFISHGHTRT